MKSSWEDVYTKTIVASGARNPNGCRPPATWFTACCAHGRKTAECDMARLARSKGHELATHTKSHSKE